MKREDAFYYFEKQGHDHVKKAKDSYIRVMTANILHSNAPNARDYELDYLERVDILTAQFLYFEPDFIGLQEVSAEQQAAFGERLGDLYSFVETPLGDYENYCFRGVRSIQNCTPMLYNKLKYEVLDSRYHLFDVLGHRSYQWALYRSLSNPSLRIIQMNMHHYCAMGEAQIPAAVEAHNELVHLRRHYPSVPIVVTGDYNFFYNTRQFEIMVEGLNMQTGMLLAEDIEPNGTDYWCHKLGSVELQQEPSAIDHITVTTDLVDVKVHRVLYNELLCKASDHCSRFLDIELKNG